MDKKLIIISLILALVSIPVITEAAKLSLEPSQEEYNLGDTFLVEIYLDSQGEYLNAIESSLTFSSDILEVQDFSQGNSILTLWVKEPAFSNEKGTIFFIGGIPAGYQGVNGLLGKIVFKAKKQGQAEVQFQNDCQVLLNDGLGTQAVLETFGASFNILAVKPGEIKDQWQEEIIQDNIPPESFKIQISQESSIFEGKYFIAFSTTDKQTGLDYYEVTELNLVERIFKKEKWQKAISPYLLEDQDLKSLIKIKAVDKAGNERIETIKPPFKLNSQNIIWLLLILVSLGISFWLIKQRK